MGSKKNKMSRSRNQKRFSEDIDFDELLEDMTPAENGFDFDDEFHIDIDEDLFDLNDNVFVSGKMPEADDSEEEFTDADFEDSFDSDDEVNSDLGSSFDEDDSYNDEEFDGDPDANGDEDFDDDTDMNGDEDFDDDTDVNGDEDFDDDTDMDGDEDFDDDTDMNGDEDFDDDTDMNGDEDFDDDTDVNGDEDFDDDTDVNGDEDFDEDIDVNDDEDRDSDSDDVCNEDADLDEDGASDKGDGTDSDDDEDTASADIDDSDDLSFASFDMYDTDDADGKKNADASESRSADSDSANKKKNERSSRVYSERELEELHNELHNDDNAMKNGNSAEKNGVQKKSKLKKVLIIVGIVLGVLALIVCFLLFTLPGRRIIYNLTGKFVHGNMEIVGARTNDVYNFAIHVPTPTPVLPADSSTDITPSVTPVIPVDENDEIFAKNYLLFGIEEINGGANTDSIIVLTVNKRDKSLKFTSILRDTYVQIDGAYPNKINSAYAFAKRASEKAGDPLDVQKYYGGMNLVKSIENTFGIKIEGFACINFKAFESIIDRLGGVDIELGATEARYLRNTNYISNPAYRTVVEGWNHMNGNQALGYCRVRKVVTLGGANNDYGRTVRQRRLIKAIITKYVNSGITELLPIMKDCLSYVTTNMTEEQIIDVLEDVVENEIFTVEENRIPYDGMFRDSSKAGIFNGSYNVTYALVIDDHIEEIRQKLHDFLYNDPTAVTGEPENVPVSVPEDNSDESGAAVGQ